MSDIIKKPEATGKFLQFCVKTYKDNMNKADADPKKAASALFILALCEQDDLESQKSNVAGFIKSELLKLIVGEDKL